MLVLTVKLLGELDLLEAQLEYHLSAGVDHVVVGRLESSSDGVREKLDRFAATDVTVESLVEPRSSARDHLRRVAIERGAEWIIESDADEFWWPRGPSLSQVLEPIPPRYTTVQALVRVFPPRPGNGSFDERMTVRPSLLLADGRKSLWTLSESLGRPSRLHSMRASARARFDGIPTSSSTTSRPGSGLPKGRLSKTLACASASTHYARAVA